MAAQRQYATAGAFRTALEARLNERARRDGVDLHRLRRQVAFDRLLARMFDPFQPVRDGWVLKGGYALEMRFHMARSTKDLDLTVRSVQGGVGDSTSLRERLQLAASIELLHALRDHGTCIIYLTGRPEFTRPKTEAWLKANGLDCHEELLMRPAGERRHAGDFKVDEIERLGERYEIVCAFEDRIDVAEAIRASGTAVFLYGAGQQAAAEALEVLDLDQDELAGR